MSDCYECGNGISKPAVTVHRGRGSDLQFCSSACYTEWSFNRAVEHMKREMPENE